VSKLWAPICVIVGVSAVSVLLGWRMFRFAESMDRAERDPEYKRQYQRRAHLRSAAIYGFAIVVGVWQVLSGAAPLQVLLVLPILLLLVLVLLRAAKQLKTPPNQRA
jgi:membrane protein implicated in regulation of membrane protease activity